ncbi:MAG: hypothetical protein LAN84_13250 [Acidobacteriia bacterium]|nr:hypothetical protein [Terriglobia bacterium]
MKRSIAIAITLIVVLWLGSTPALAQGGRPAGGPGGGMSHPGGGMGGGSRGSMGSDAGGPADHGSSHAAASSPTTVLSRNSKLDSKLTANLQSKGLLPKGTDLKDACSGFKNLGQCVAAIHVSHNRNISFDCLKADMTGQAPAAGSSCPAGSGSSKMSLGKAIQTLDPQANAKSEAKQASKEADAEIKESDTDSGSDS